MNTLNRRSFLTAAGAAALFAGCCGTKPPRRPSANGKLNVAIIGCGTQAFANVPHFLMDPRVRVTCVCDPVLTAPGYSYRAQETGGRLPFKQKVDAHYGDASCRMTADWREVIGDPTVDAVVVITPDHWHALIAIAAMKEGKHVYCQKPMSLGISDGKEMVRVAKETGVVFQVGSQHRTDSSFRQAGELVLSGYIGTVKSATVGLPGRGPGEWNHSTSTTPRKPPAYFTPEGWQMWLGPSEHWENDAFIPAIHEPMCWRWNSRTGGGMITDWGAHWIDILHWTTDRERTGPTAVENMTTSLGNDRYLDWGVDFAFDLVYADGFRAHVSSVARCGVTYHGDKGEIFADWTKLERPASLRKWSEKRDLKDSDRHLYRAANGHNHESDFIDGIFEQRPIATDCEIGHRSISPCHIANICERLRLPRLDWDPVAERFVGANADAANALCEVPHHNGWSI